MTEREAKPVERGLAMAHDGKPGAPVEGLYSATMLSLMGELTLGGLPLSAPLTVPATGITTGIVVGDIWEELGESEGWLWLGVEGVEACGILRAITDVIKIDARSGRSA